jgi:hypothetical protein
MATFRPLSGTNANERRTKRWGVRGPLRIKKTDTASWDSHRKDRQEKTLRRLKGWAFEALFYFALLPRCRVYALARRVLHSLLVRLVCSTYAVDAPFGNVQGEIAGKSDRLARVRSWVDTLGTVGTSIDNLPFEVVVRVTAGRQKEAEIAEDLGLTCETVRRLYEEGIRPLLDALKDDG